ncbi:DivIVA domain-containing protein [Bowdeniella nasicola]|uniref:Cell wall synthesis protein Wag31 n=1 Tax=Bowdeniella nasicola TaxID=208480 RepID=A0A1H4B919_9ACTO|nr:DivIVA domain-containing protein [Bowdeniella nasicola]SEA44639.1 DivIVA domain-containing protein [Bowdeniella nasicola]
MALLTADDVLNKKFQQTKFREGYDQDEVDDFLDEVVNTLRAVQSENEELKAKLQAAERRISELGAGGGDYQPAEETPAQVDEPVAEEVETPAEPEVHAEPAEEQAAVEPQAHAFAAPGEGGDSAQSAAGMLALAQRLHDEYVRNGQDEGERIVTEARQQGDSIIKEAEDKYNNTLAQLEKERSLLERKIDELRTFERDYRSRLKSYLEGLLRDVEASPETLS